MKIALITDGISPFIIGGMQQHSAYLGKYLVESGHEVDLFHCVNNKTNKPSFSDVNKLFFSNSFSFRKVNCFTFPKTIYFPGHYLWCSFKYSKMIYNSIKNDLEDYDFIYSKGFTAWKILISRKKINYINLKIGVKFHGYEMFQYAPNLKIKLQHFMFRPFVKWINKNSDIVFSYGGKITSLIQDLDVINTKIVEIPTAIENDWLINQSRKTSKTLKFLFIGRNEKRKGVDKIFSAIDILNKKDHKIEFHFIGPVFRKNKENSSLTNLVYHGVVDDVSKKKQIIDKCDVLICPSFSEGMPNVILEAMSRGLAIISTDVGAVSRMVDKTNGVILNSNNPELLAKTIIRISENSFNLDKMKNKSLKKVKDNFLWENIIKKTISEIRINT
jgi:glycosyltransferase involved in cell wall biosynthesis